MQARWGLLLAAILLAGCGSEEAPSLHREVSDRHSSASGGSAESAPHAGATPATPSGVLGAYSQGQAHLCAGRYREAAACLTAAIDEKDHESGFTEAYQLRGLAYERLGNRRDADRDFARAESIARIQAFLGWAVKPGERAVVIHRAVTVPADAQGLGEPCCNLMAPADGPPPRFLEVGTELTITKLRGGALGEYRRRLDGKVETGLVDMLHVAVPVETAQEPLRVPASAALFELMKSAAAYRHLRAEFTRPPGESGYPVTLTLRAHGDTHPVLGRGAHPRWTATLRNLQEWGPVLEYLADVQDFYTAYKEEKSNGPEVPDRTVLWLSVPQPVVFSAGSKGNHLLLSQEAQRYLEVSFQSTYAAKRHALIIQEQHNYAAGHFRQVKGLEVLFADNPWLLAGDEVCFLSEGTDVNTRLNVKPLVAVTAQPSDGLIRSVLRTFLIPGYVAWEWKHQTGVPIIGYEDPNLYRISARLLTNQSRDRPAVRKLWWQAVIARNRTMAEGLLREMDRREYPILFMGGRHLQGLDPDNESPDWAQLGGILSAEDTALVRRQVKRGVSDILKDAGVGCTYLAGHQPLLSPFDETTDRQQYLELFEAQRSGDLDPYFRRYVRHACPTVQADCKAGAKAARTLSANPQFVRDYQTSSTRCESACFKSEGEARAFARTKVGSDPVEVEAGKLRSQDGKWQYRAKDCDVSDRHVHLERLNPETGEVLLNWHLRWPKGTGR